MLLNEGLTRVQSQKRPKLHFGESFALIAGAVDSVRSLFPDSVHTPVDLKVCKSWTLWKINLQKYNNFFCCCCCTLFSSPQPLLSLSVENVTALFFFFVCVCVCVCVIIEAANKGQRKNTHVCSTPHLMESCWKVHFVWGSWRIFFSFFLFYNIKSGSFSPTECDKRVRAPWRIALFLLSPTQRDVCNNAANLHGAPWVTLSWVNPLLSKQSFTFTSKPESLLLMSLLIVMGRS